MTHPLRLYGHGLLTAGEPGSWAHARMEDGSTVAVALERYTSPADETDEKILRSIRGPVLDVGCGPGRHLHLLARRGDFALGVDLSRIAVELARGGGGLAIVASIFDELPGAGTWRSALLLDGNIGIGGEPARLLTRVHGLLMEGGEALIELDPPEALTTRSRARLETAYGTSAWFPWARVAATDAPALAAATGFHVSEQVSEDNRWFARLVKGAIASRRRRRIVPSARWSRRGAIGDDVALGLGI